jgi:hypothetical protein
MPWRFVQVDATSSLPDFHRVAIAHAGRTEKAARRRPFLSAVR